MRFLIAYIIGLIFGLGILFAGMANPAKVINFFDVAGPWDPSLAFVMGGALCVTFLGYRFVLKRPHPLMEHAFALPTVRDIDLKLVGGSAIFGVGWGISGFCPGGALPAIGTGRSEVLMFVAALVVGIYAAKFFQKAQGGKDATAATHTT
jgi:uncharacterized membrane protein YedE/YeeE